MSKRQAKTSKGFALFAVVAALLFTLRKLLRVSTRIYRAKAASVNEADYLKTTSPLHGRQFEEARFLSGAIPAHRIEEVVGGYGKAINPVRVYAPLEIADSPQGRAEWALTQLKALGGLDRSTILVICPTGKGYIHPIVPESLELATRGDCATVAIQYNDDMITRVSKQVETGANSLRAMVELLVGLPRSARPKIIVYGESLGSWGAQEGILGLTDIGLSEVEGALFCGTPGTASHTKNDLIERLDGMGIASQSVRTPDELKSGTRFAFMDNEDDPISYFSGLNVLWRPQPWIPRRKRTRWIPGWTSAKALIEIESSTRPTPGVRTSSCHDYRQTSPTALRHVSRMRLMPKEIRRIEDFLTEHERTRKSRIASLKSFKKHDERQMWPSVISRKSD